MHALRTHFPDRKITMIGKYPASRLSVELGLADEWVPLEKGRIWRKAFRERPEYMVSFGRRSHFPTLLGRLLGARLIAFRSRYLSLLPSRKIDYDASIYRGINYRRLLETHGIPQTDYSARQVGEDHDAIVFMPGGTSGYGDSLLGLKKWGLDRYYEVFLRLRATHPQYRFKFLLGPTEHIELDWLQKQSVVPSILFTPKIATLFSEIQTARLVIGNDCGPAHVAHALGKDIVQLFFRPNPEWFLPRDGAIQLLGHDDDIRAISIEQVETAARTVLNR